MRSYRYAAWIDRHRRAVLVAAFVVAVTGALGAARLQLASDPSYLLPESSRAVVELRAIQARTQAFGRLVAVVESADPIARDRAARELGTALAAISPDLVARVTLDDGELRRFAQAHALLYAPLADLQQVRDVLRRRIARAKLAANPVFISLDDDDPDTELRDLRARLTDAEQQAKAPRALVSENARMQVVLVAATFASTDVHRSQQLAADVQRVVAQVRAHAPRGVEVGVSGDVIQAVNEQRAIERGMLHAVLATVVLVGLLLLWYFGSWIGVASLLGSLAVGTLATFGITYVAIGHLNSATAFLASIVIGNGINFPLILLARHFEERRAGRSGIDALGGAIASTARGTLAAAAAAGVAYASLNVTSFRGFWHFGVIGGVGMALCWVAAYTVLPAALCVLERRGLRVRREPAIGAMLARLAPARPRVVVAVTAALGLAAGLATWRYVASDPFEYDFRALRSTSEAAAEANDWMRRIDAAFGRGLAGGFVYAVDRPEDAVRLAATARRPDLGAPRGLADVLPTDQPAKLAVLAELRAMIDEERDQLDDAERAEVDAHRPPTDLRALTLADIPPALAREYTERDGTRGRLVFQAQGPAIDVWDGRDLVRLARTVRALDLPAGTRVSGTAFLFADMITEIRTDGPRSMLAALVGVLLFTGMIVGIGRAGMITIASGALGTVGMVAACSLLGLRVNFLDFIALPITLGIAVDYSVNVVARVRTEPALGLARLLATTGSAVLLCSLTTTIGYASLLLSDNGAIRSFGLAAIIGEGTCLATALIVAPALLGLARGGGTSARPRSLARAPARLHPPGK